MVIHYKNQVKILLALQKKANIASLSVILGLQALKQKSESSTLEKSFSPSQGTIFITILNQK
jgi:hypothetical protein